MRESGITPNEVFPLGQRNEGLGNCFQRRNDERTDSRDRDSYWEAEGAKRETCAASISYICIRLNSNDAEKMTTIRFTISRIAQQNAA